MRISQESVNSFFKDFASYSLFELFLNKAPCFYAENI